MVVFELGPTASNGRQIGSRHDRHRRNTLLGSLFGCICRFRSINLLPYIAHHSLHRTLCVWSKLTACFIHKNICKAGFSMLVEILVTPSAKLQFIVSVINRFQSHVCTSLLLFLLFDLLFKYGLIEFGEAVSLCLLLCHGLFSSQQACFLIKEGKLWFLPAWRFSSHTF